MQGLPQSRQLVSLGGDRHEDHGSACQCGAFHDCGVHSCSVCSYDMGTRLGSRVIMHSGLQV